MGKARRQRIRGKKDNPLGITSGRLEEALTFDSEENSFGPVDAVRSELLNANIEEKLNGLQSLAVLTNSKEKVISICRPSSDIIRIVAPLLCEKNIAIRQAAAGALRNLSVTGGAEFCEYLVEQDVLTPLLTLLNEYIADKEWKPTFDKSMREQMDLRSDTFLQSINLLWNLCESTSMALDTFNQSILLGGVIRYLDYEVFGMDIALSVAQFLLVTSENNSSSWNILNQHLNVFLRLLQLQNASDSSHSHLYLSALAAGVLSNVPALAAANHSAILNCLSAILEVNHETLLKETLEAIGDEKRRQSVPELEVKNTDMMDEESDEAAAQRRRLQELPTDADMAMLKAGYLIDSQKIAAEIITNLCSPEDEEWMDDDDDEGDDSNDEGVCDYVETANGGSVSSLCQKLPAELSNAIKNLCIVDKLWLKTKPLPNEVFQALRNVNVTLLMKTKNLRISSLIALQNLCNSLETTDLGGTNAIYNVWVELGQQVFKGPQDVAVIEPTTSLMRSALEHLKKSEELFVQMTQSDLELMLNGVRNCSVAEVRANWLRMLGTLGCLLPEELVRLIVAFIVETCKEEEDVWTISEALDSLMDMFADNDWPKIINELDLSENCRILDKILKTKLKQQKRELKERFPAVQTVRSNFSRFVQYIQQEAAKTVTKP